MTSDHIIEDRFLGSFERTYVRRVPQVGEYYLCEITRGVALAKMPLRFPKEILKPLNMKPLTHLQSKHDPNSRMA